MFPAAIGRAATGHGAIGPAATARAATGDGAIGRAATSRAATARAATRRGGAATVLTAATLVLTAGCALAPPRPVQPLTSPTGQQARVVRIVDGDTVRLVGHGNGPLPEGEESRVRLLEIDAPEVRDCYGKAATAALTRLLPVGATVQVTRDVSLRDRYGRFLLYLWTAEGTFVNLGMVRDGHARAVLYGRDDLHIDTLRAAEAEARAQRRGLWSACPDAGKTPRPSRSRS